MSALYTALVESETKESLALMVCELREKLNKVSEIIEKAEYLPDVTDVINAVLIDGKPKQT